MTRLEYRLHDSSRSFPLLFIYDDIDSEEISNRLVCDWFVKEDRVFEKVATAVSPTECILFVKEAEEEEVISRERLTRPVWEGLRLEVREYVEGAVYYRVVEILHFDCSADLRLYLQCDCFYLQEREWKKLSAEIDENRRVFVLYAQPTQ
ncbi:hypothetical protein [Salinithrix halophila]|uniref:Uncharacterized protein n=1 Tax=Salinithrix halophila TaxID=1485204 RepID=A0ABV8JJB4_9BACL